MISVAKKSIKRFLRRTTPTNPMANNMPDKIK
jgi:hypothetical protein